MQQEWLIWNLLNVSDYGFNEADAYQLITQVGELYVGNMVDTIYSLVASIDKKHLKRLGR